MSNSTIILNKEYFTEEITKNFLIDLEEECSTMEADLFAKLFIKYDLSLVSTKNKISSLKLL